MGMGLRRVTCALLSIILSHHLKIGPGKAGAKHRMSSHKEGAGHPNGTQGQKNRLRAPRGWGGFFYFLLWSIQKQLTEIINSSIPAPRSCNRPSPSGRSVKPPSRASLAHVLEKGGGDRNTPLTKKKGNGLKCATEISNKDTVPNAGSLLYGYWGGIGRYRVSSPMADGKETSRWLKRRSWDRARFAFSKLGWPDLSWGSQRAKGFPPTPTRGTSSGGGCWKAQS